MTNQQHEPQKVHHCEADPPDVQAGKTRTLRAYLEEELPDLVRETTVWKDLKTGSDPNALFTKEDVASRLNVSPRTVDTLAAAGEIRKITVRGCVRHHPKAVEVYIRRKAGLNSHGNLGFLLVICCGALVGMLWDSTSYLAGKISRTIQRVEERGWEQSLLKQQGHIAGTKPDVWQINIDLLQKDQWYKRPWGLVLLAVTSAVLTQLILLSFGLV